MLKGKRLLAIIMVLFLGLAILPATPAIAEKLDDFPVRARMGELVADADTRYITTYKQDSVTKLITATVQVQNGSASQEKIYLNGIGIEISFNEEKVAPYAYDPQNAVFDSNLLFQGKIDSNDIEFRKYCQPLLTKQVNQSIHRFDYIGTDYIERNGKGGRLGAKLSGSSSAFSELIIDPGQTLDIIEFYFMPVNGADKLDISMFGYEYMYDIDKSIRVSTWIGNGSYYMQASGNNMGSSAIYVISPSSFKVHVQHPLPDVSANNGARIINGYNNETMEWSYDKDGSYTSGAPIVKDIAHSIYVRVKGNSAYSYTDTFYVNYKKYLTSDAAEVVFAAKIPDHVAAVAYIKKAAANLSSSDNKTRVGDVIEYTITVKNNGAAGSVWANAVLTDRISDYVIIDTASIIPGNGSYNPATRILTVNLGDIASGEEKVVKFSVTVSVNAYEKDITNSVTVSGKDGKGGDAEDLYDTVKEEGGDRIVEPEPGQSAQPGINPVTEGDRVVTGTGVPGAQIVVTLPGGDKLSTTVGGDGKWNVTVPAGKELNINDKVSAVQTENGKKPSDAQEVTVQAKTGAIPYVNKVGSNKTSNDGKTSVGDVIEYTITVKNNGVAGTTWANATLTDRISDYVTIDTASIIPANGSYNPATRILTVNLSNIAAGEEKVVKFSVTVNINAYEKDITNGVTVSGKDGKGGDAEDLNETTKEEGGDRIVEPEPAQSAQPGINPVTEGDRVVTGTGVPGAQIVVTLPDNSKLNTTVRPNGTWDVEIPAGKELNINDKVNAVQTETGKKPSEPQEVTVQAKTGAIPYVNKVANNQISKDGKTRVEDIIEYTITVKNNGVAGTTWANAVLTDRISDYVTIDTASIIPANGSYNPATRILTVNLGDIAAGVVKEVKFRVTVNANAYDQDITNGVTVSGKDGKGGDAEDLYDTVKEEGGDRIVEPEPGQSAQPGINPVTEGDRVITGTGVPGAQIVVTLPGGDKLSTTVGGDGKWNVTVPAGKELNINDKVSALQTENGKKPSDAQEVTVQAKTGAIPYVNKVGSNKTSNDGKTSVGDVIEYTITVKNNGAAGTTWANATLTDRISDYVTIDTASIIPSTGSYNSATRILTVNLGDIAAGVVKEVKFRVTVDANAYEKDITNGVTVNGKDGKGGDAENLDETVKEDGGDRIVEPEPGQSAQPVINPVTEGDRVITGTGVPGAQIVVTLPDGDKLNTTVRPNGTWDVEIPTGKNLNINDKVNAVQTETGKKPSEPQEVTVQAKTGAIANVKKVAANLSSSDNKTRVDDIIEYTITVKNNGVAGTTWANAVLTDRISDYVTIDTASIIPANGSYNPATRILTVNLGDIAAGVVKEVKFRVTVNINAYEKDITNGVTVSGKDGKGGDGADDLDQTVKEDGGDRIVEPEPGQSAQPGINPVTEGDRVVTGTGVPGAQIVVTLPDNSKLNTTVRPNGTWDVEIPTGKNLNINDKVSSVQTEDGKKPSDAQEVTVKAKTGAIANVKKVAANLSSSDNKTRVGDVIEYTITVKNNGAAGTTWANATLTDRISDYVTIDTASIIPGTGSYNTATRILTVNLGDIAAGVVKEVKFHVTVNANAYDQDITNGVTVSGKDGKGGDAEDLNETTKEDGGDRIVEPEPGQSAQPGINPVTEGDRVVTGTGVPGAQIVVTLPDNSKLTTTVRPNGTWDVEIPTGKNLNINDKVSAVQTETGKKPSEPQEVTVQAKTGAIPYVNKVANNQISKDGKTRVEDVIEYTITVKNNGAAGTTWANAVLTDRISDYVTIDTASIIPATGSYNTATRMLMVNLGDIAAGVVKEVKFRVSVNANAYDQDITNGVTINGKDGKGGDADNLDETTKEEGGDRIVQPEPGQSAQPGINPVTEGDRVVTGTGVPGAQIVVTLPGGDKLTTEVGGDGKWNVTVPAGKELNINDKVSAVQTETGKKPSEPQEVTVLAKTGAIPYVKKVAYNMNSTDDKTRVGDFIEYTITVKNNGAAGTTWANAVLTDRISDYVTIDTASIIPATGSYNTATRILTVNLGDIAAGVVKEVKFRVTVNANAYEKDITNSVTVQGKDGKGGGAGDLNDTVKEEGGDRIVEPGQVQPKQVVVTFDDNGGKVQGESSRFVIVGQPYGALPGAIRSGYTFDGWYTEQEETKGTKVDKDTVVTNNADHRLYAHWTAVSGPGGGGGTPPPPPVNYTVTFNGNGGTPITLTCKVVAGNSLGDKNMPANPIRAGYSFMGWNFQADGKGIVFTSATKINNDITVYAQWIRNGGGGGGDGLTRIDNGQSPLSGFFAEHIPYITGYPDNTVRPNNAITRAEVAMIFFRLLSSPDKYDPRTSIFKDVADGAWYAQAVSYLSSIEILTGYPDSSFRPNQPITRAEFAAVASRFDNLAENSENAFPDVANHWAKNYINSAYAKGWVSGYPDGAFKPQQNITRAEVVKVVNTMLNRKIHPEDIPAEIKQFTDITGHWAYAEIVEACNDHDFTRRNDGFELWTLK